MPTSGIQSNDLGTASSSIPQKSDEFQVRNSFVQRCVKKKKDITTHKLISVRSDEQIQQTES